MAMKIFISWSGERSKKLAQALRVWIPKVIQDVDPWMSGEDIDKGSNWALDLTRQLDDTHFGIICLTPENLTEPWILFEAGALSKKVEQSRVCPYLLGLRPSEVKPPLSNFQAAIAEKDETTKLLKSINKAAEQTGARSLGERDLDEVIDVWWSKLEDAIKGIGPAKTAPPPQRKDRDILEEILKIVRSLERSSKAPEYTLDTLASIMATPSPGRVSMPPTLDDFIRQAKLAEGKDKPAKE